MLAVMHSAMHSDGSAGWRRFSRCVLLGLLAAVIGAAAMTSSGCASAEKWLGGLDKPAAKIVSADLQNLSLDGATVLLGVEVSNPYQAPLPLTSLDYVLGSGGRQIVAGAFDGGELGASTIPARGSKVLSVPAGVKFADLLGALEGVRPGAVVPYTADIGLSVDAPAVGRVELPRMKKEGQVPVPAVPEVAVESVRWDELGLERAGGTVRLNVKNTNQFAANLRELNYGLKLGGSSVASGTIARPLSLKGGETGTVEIPIEFSPRQFGMSLLRALMGGDARYDIGGNMAVGTPFGDVSLPYSGAGTTKLGSR